MMRGYGYNYGYGPGGMMSGYGGGLIGFAFMLFFGLLIVAGIVLIVVWAMRSKGGGSAGTGSQQEMDRACQIARERLAKGEITVEEYENLKCTLDT